MIPSACSARGFPFDRRYRVFADATFEYADVSIPIQACTG
jgi:hypothetical protein